MNCNYKVNIKDIQNKYKFNIFAMGGYNDSDLRKMIESVYYALPRTTGTGTSVTLNDTAFSYMKNKLYATDTSQYTTTGKNLVDFETQSFTTFKDYTGLNISAGTYTFSAKVTSSDTSQTISRVYFYGESGGTDQAFINLSRNTRANATVTTTFDIKRIVLYSSVDYASSNGKTATYKDIQLESGSTATDYEPYTNGASPNPDYPQVIHTITGDNEVVVCGKNLASNIFSDYSKIVGAYRSMPIKLEQGQTYILKANRVGELKTSYYNYGLAKDGYSFATFVDPVYAINYNSGGTATVTLTIDSSYTNPVLFCYTSNEEIFDELFTNYEIQLEKGSTATTYEPYQSNSVVLTLGDKEICKIGDYEDKIFKAIKGNEVYDSLASEEKATLDYGKWYLRKYTGKLVLNGTEADWIKSSNQNVDRFITSLSASLYLNNSNSKCNYFIKSGLNEEIGKWTNNNGSQLVFNYSAPGTTTLEQFKTWAGTHNIELVQPLVTPTNEKFNDTIQEQLEDIYNNMLSYEGTTNISQENADLPFNINSTAIKDLNNL